MSQISKLCLYSYRKNMITDPKFDALQRVVTDVFTEKLGNDKKYED